MKKILLLIFFVMMAGPGAYAQDKLKQLTEDLERLIDRKDWQGAKRKIDYFYANQPDPPTELDIIEKYEVDKFNARVIQAIEQEDRLYQRLINNNSVELCKNYLNNYPYGKYRDHVSTLLAEQTDEQAWQKAKAASSTSAYYEYIDNYPKGKYLEQAKETVKRWDRTAYEKASTENTSSAYNSYLNNYPRGEYRSEAREGLKQSVEHEQYMKAVNSRNISDYETYLSKYPNGKYASEVSTIIENGYYKFGNDAFASKQWSTAKDHYETYIAKYPSGRYTADVKRKIAQSQRKLNQTSSDFVMYTYEAGIPIGFSVGSLYTSGAGLYMNMKMNTEFFTWFDALYKIDNSGNHDGIADHLIPVGERVVGNMAVSGGATFMLFYPLWGYAGAGVGYMPVLQNYDEYTYDSRNRLVKYSDGYYRNTDESKFFFFPEAGLNLKVADTFVLKYGFNYQQGINQQLGIGFAF